MGLQDVQLPLHQAVEAAYESLMNMPLEDGYRCGWGGEVGSSVSVRLAKCCGLLMAGAATCF